MAVCRRPLLFLLTIEEGALRKLQFLQFAFASSLFLTHCHCATALFCNSCQMLVDPASTVNERKLSSTLAFSTLYQDSECYSASVKVIISSFHTKCQQNTATATQYSIDTLFSRGCKMFHLTSGILATMEEAQVPSFLFPQISCQQTPLQCETQLYL